MADELAGPSTPRGAPPTVPGYGALEFVYGARHCVYRARRLKDGRSVIIKTRDDSLGDLRGDMMRKEWELLRALKDAPGVVRALDFVQADGVSAMILEDGGESLDMLLDRARRAETISPAMSTSVYSSSAAASNNDSSLLFSSFPLLRRIEVARDITAAVEQLHQRDLLHLDIKPANILVSSPATQQRARATSATMTGVDTSTSTAAGNPSGLASPGGEEAGAGPLKVKIADLGCAVQGTLPYTEAMIGSPAYLSPEQTGRTSGSIDRRSDLYGLGVLLYELFTLRLPFEYTHAADFVQAHLARVAAPPSSIVPSLPAPLDKIIMKLLNKDKEKRYESAHGLYMDLELCRTALIAATAATTTPPATGVPRIADFSLGAHDRAGTLRAPRQLWGRENDVNRLMGVVEAARGGACNAALIEGPSGIGKSSLIEEVYRRCSEGLTATTAPAATTTTHSGPTGIGGAANRGKLLFAVGKGELTRRIPYNTLDQAVGQIIVSLQMEGPRAVATARMALRNTLGDDADLLAATLPSLQALLGPPPSDFATDSDRVHGRFLLAVLQLFKLLATAERTVILYIDDIQWCEESTLKAVESLLASDRLTNLMVILAYRTSELPGSHQRFLESSSSFNKATRIAVTGLHTVDIAGLIIDVTGCPPEDAAQLAAIVAKRTSGNPLHVMEVMRFLYANRVLTFDSARRTFTWDLSLVRSSINSTGDVADMVAQRMAGLLTDEAAWVLAAAALLGAQFSANLIKAVVPLSRETIKTALSMAVDAGIIERYSGTLTLRFPHATGESDEMSALEEEPGAALPVPVVPFHEEMFRFLHDKIHEVAMTLKRDKHGAIHAAVGRALLERYTAPDYHDNSHHDPTTSSTTTGSDNASQSSRSSPREYPYGRRKNTNWIFEICDHLNAAVALGVALPASINDRLVGLNLDAAKASRRLMTFDASAKFIGAAKRHLIRRARAASGASTAAADVSPPAAADGGIALTVPTSPEDEELMWAFDPTAAMQVTRQGLSVALQLDDTAGAEQALASGVAHAASVVEKCKLLTLVVYSGVAKLKPAEAVKTGREALRLIGRPLVEENPGEYAAALIKKHHLTDLGAVDRLADLKQATDEETLVLSEIIGSYMLVTYLADSAYLPAICAMAWDVAIEQGVTAALCSPLVMQCIVLAAMGEFEVAHSISDYILALMRKYKFREAETSPLTLVAALIRHWSRPYPEAQQQLQAAIKCGMEVGDYEYTSYSHLHTHWMEIVDGTPLPNIVRDLPEHIAFSRHSKNALSTGSQTISLRICAKLMRHERFAAIIREANEHVILDEAEFEKSIDLPYCATAYQILMGFFHVLMDNPAEACAYLDKAEPRCALIQGVVLTKLVPFLQVMAIARQYPLAASSLRSSTTSSSSPIVIPGTKAGDKAAEGKSNGGPSVEQIKRMEEYIKKLESWATACPANLRPHLLLAQVEFKRVTGADHGELTRLLAESIQLAEASRCLWLVGLAHECAGRLWAQIGLGVGFLESEYREQHLKAAISAYRRWGAPAKAELVRVRPASLFNSSSASSSAPSTPSSSVEATPPLARSLNLTNSGGGSGGGGATERATNSGGRTVTAGDGVDDEIDALFLLKGSQVISSELHPERLFDVALPVLTESAGAEHAIMIRVDLEGNLFAAAKFSEAMHRDGSILPPFMSLEPDAPITSRDVLLPLVHLVIQSREPRIVADTMRDTLYWNDVYVNAHKPRSVLVAPMFIRGRIAKVLYMENNLYPGTFTQRRLTFVKVLLNQTSISVENARLYAQYEDSTRSLQGSVATRNAEMQGALAAVTTARDGAVLVTQAQAAWLAAIAHDLRTPMSSIISLATLLLETRLDAEQLENVNIIKSSSEALVKQVEAILDMKRESSQLSVVPEATDLRACINDCALVLRVQATAKNLALKTHFEDDLPAVVMTDALRVRQIVINLVGNAIKFTDHGSVTVALQATEVPAPAEHCYGDAVPAEARWYRVHCAVTDTGMGISAEGIAQLFRPFEQVDSSAERRTQGTGLGLVISKNLCELMGGTIWVESVPGKGSTFHFTFLCPALANTSLPSSRTEAPLPGMEVPLRILIVDDHHINLKVLEKMLGRLGYHTQKAFSGAEALKAVNEAAAPFDLIFLDVHMAGMSGFETARAVREAKPEQTPRIIALTADQTIEQEVKEGSEFDDILLKPVKLTDLMALVRLVQPIKTT